MSSRSRLQKKTPANPLYLKHSPLLVLAIVCFFWILNIVTTKNPDEVANFVITQLYLPLIAPFFLFMTFLFGYLTLNIKRGGVIALFTTLLLLFRLQQIQFETWWVVPFLIVFVIFVIVAKKTKKQSKREKFQSSDESEKKD